MNNEDLLYFDIKNYSFPCEIQCPHCDEWTHSDLYTECETYCEDCGEHYGMKCPLCDYCIDGVYNKLIGRPVKK